MSSVVSRPTKGSRANLLLGAMIASSFLVFLAQTGAQGTKTTDAASKKKASVKPEELYGDQGGEKVAPADARLPNTVLRARHEDPFLKLSNPRIGLTGGKKKVNGFLVDYEVLLKGPLDGMVLVLRSEDGGRAEVALSSLGNRDSGTIELVGTNNIGPLKFAKSVKVPDNLEMYVMRVNDRYEPPLKCMVSSAVVMGKMKTSTRPRDWTADEITRYTGPPLAYKNPNGNPGVGEDVPPLPAVFGAPQFRYVDPNGRLLGLDFVAADFFGKKTVWRLAPVYSAEQPKQNNERSIARNGYAVAGAEVNVEKSLVGIRLLFQRVKADGKFDPKDAYEGDWIGSPPAAGKATVLVNDGRRVLGINFQQGAIVDRFSLVAEDKAK
jgi:hypothetical protein